MTPKPEDGRSAEPPDDAPQRKRGAAAGGSDEPGRTRSPDGPDATLSDEPDTPRHREEVVGQGSGETAGGSPVLAGGDNAPAQPSAPDPALDFDPETLGGVSSNTPPSIPKSDSNEFSDSLLTTGGEDWFEVCLYLEHQRFDWLAGRLNAAKEAAEHNRDGADELVFGDLRAICLPVGVRAGGRINYRWQFRTDKGLLFQLINRAEPHVTMPNGIVRIESMPLMRYGTTACWQMVGEWLAAMGIKLVRNRLSRVDICVDLPGVEFKEFSTPLKAGHYVSRARQGGRRRVEEPSEERFNGRRETSFWIGKGKRFRVYDKLEETKHNPEKRALVLARRWGELPVAACRPEFQLRREALKGYGVDTVEDWFELRAAIALTLCEKWFRITDGPVDPKHPERSRVLPLWWEVARAFADWAGDSADIELPPVPRAPADLQHLLAQLYGLTLAILVRAGRVVASADDLAYEGTCLLLSVAEHRKVAQEWRRKAFQEGWLTEGVALSNPPHTEHLVHCGRCHQRFALTALRWDSKGQRWVCPSWPVCPGTGYPGDIADADPAEGGE